MSGIQMLMPQMMGVAASMTAINSAVAGSSVAANGMSVRHATMELMMPTVKQLVWSPSSSLGKVAIPTDYPRNVANVGASMEPITRSSEREETFASANIFVGAAVIGLGCVVLYAVSRMFKAAKQEMGPNSTSSEDVPPVVQDANRPTGAARVRTSGIGTWAQGIRSGHSVPPPKDGDAGPRGIS